MPKPKKVEKVAELKREAVVVVPESVREALRDSSTGFDPSLPESKQRHLRT